MPVKFILFDFNSAIVKQWEEAFQAHVPPECAEHVTIKHCTLDELEAPLDCLVSPANSFGRLDGR